jgi:hypothetical protein
MDEDGFTQVKKKGAPRKQQGVPGGRTGGHGPGQKRSHGQHTSRGPRGPPQSGRAAKGQDSRQQGRGKPGAGQPARGTPDSAARQGVTGPVRSIPAPVHASNLVIHQPGQRSSQKTPKKDVQLNAPASSKGTMGMCFAKVVASSPRKQV